MANVNERIFREGKIVKAKKLAIVTIGIGLVKNLDDLDGVIWHDDDGKVVISTKEAPDGCTYDQELMVVVRLIRGKVKMNNQYDIYALDMSEAEKFVSNRPIYINTLTKKQLSELKSIFDVASEIRPSIAPAVYGRKVIIITDEMVGKEGYINCHCLWNPDDILTKLYPGDVFIVEDEETCKGYRIGKEEFAGTHKLAK